MEVVRVFSDADWCGIYINGRLVQEGHSIDFDDLMEIFIEEKSAVTSFEMYEASCKWLEDRGNLPDFLEDVVMEDV